MKKKHRHIRPKVRNPKRRRNHLGELPGTIPRSVLNQLFGAALTQALGIDWVGLIENIQESEEAEGNGGTIQ